MRHYFLDTNVVFDYLGQRVPFAAAAASLFEAAHRGHVTLYVSSLSFSHIFYSSRKLPGAEAARNLLIKLADRVTIAAVTDDTVRTALWLPIVDVEDALQYASAAAVPALNALVTRDLKGFPSAGVLPVIGPATAVEQLNLL